jgi:hypothetical protein
MNIKSYLIDTKNAVQDAAASHTTLELYKDANNELT